jgi:hypothetical protein
MATVAVFLALGGSAVAVTQISGSSIKDRSIAGTKLKKDAATVYEIKQSTLNIQQKCQQGTVLGFAVVLGASPSFGSSYVTSHVAPGARNCPGKKPVQARRAGVGDYYVRFVDNEAEIVVGTPIGLNPASLVWEKVPDPTIGGERVFHIKTFNASGVPNTGQPIDATFSMLMP